MLALCRCNEGLGRYTGCGPQRPRTDGGSAAHETPCLVRQIAQADHDRSAWAGGADRENHVVIAMEHLRRSLPATVTACDATRYARCTPVYSTTADPVQVIARCSFAPLAATDTTWLLTRRSPVDRTWAA